MHGDDAKNDGNFSLGKGKEADELSDRIGVMELNVSAAPEEGNAKEESLEEALDRIGGEMGNPLFLRIFKQEKQLEVWMKVDSDYRLLKRYPICRYSGELGPKLKKGDGQSPEGFYEVRKSSLNPNSRYHLAMNIGYPNAYDRYYERTGSDIMIHGGCFSVGCYAMGDKAIEEIYDLTETALENGQEAVNVHIFPFRMSPGKMQWYADNPWYGFWKNLQEGYDLFEKSHQVPVVSTHDGKYFFDQDQPKRR